MQNFDAMRLGQIIESRSGKERILGGEYIAFNGIIMIAVYALNHFVYSAWWTWLLGMGVGWAGILIYSYFKERRDGRYSTRVQGEIFALWIAIAGVAVPLIVVIFPGYFHLYTGKAIFPLVYLILGIAAWLTGVIAKSIEFKLGALAFIIGTFLSIFYNNSIQLLIIFTSMMITGMVVPGIVSKLNEKRG